MGQMVTLDGESGRKKTTPAGNLRVDNL